MRFPNTPVDTSRDKKYEAKAIFRNTSWLLVDRLLRMSVGLFIGLWLARYLGSENFGIYSYAIAFSGLFQSLSTLGLESIAIRDIVREPSKSGEILGTVFSLQLIGGLISLLLVIGTIIGLRPNETLTHWIVIIVAAKIPLNAFSTFDIWFQSQCKSKYTVCVKLFVFILVSALKVIAINAHAPLVIFAWVFLLESILFSAGIGLAYKLVLERYTPLWAASVARAKTLLSSSWSLLVSEVVIMVYMRIDQIMIKEFLGNSEVGIYSLAIRFTEIWYFIPIAIVNSIFPAIILLRETDELAYKKRLQQLYKIVTWVSLSIVLGTQFLAKYLIVFSLGQDYTESATILSITIWVIVFASQGIARGKWLVMEILQSYSFMFIGFFVLCYVSLYYLWIPIYGLKGAALATILSQAVVAIFAPMLFRKTRPSSFMLIKAFTPLY